MLDSFFDELTKISSKLDAAKGLASKMKLPAAMGAGIGGYEFTRHKTLQAAEDLALGRAIREQHEQRMSQSQAAQ